MFGYTFSNLKHELQFIQNALFGFDEGDLFLLEVALHELPLPLTEPAIRRQDPTLRGGVFQEFDPRSLIFFPGPLLRNRRNVREVKVARDVQSRGLVLGLPRRPGNAHSSMRAASVPVPSETARSARCRRTRDLTRPDGG